MVAILIPLYLFACGQVELNDFSHEYISEYRQNLFLAKSNTFTASFTSGQREKNYYMDGEKTDLVDFGVLTVVFSTNFDGALPPIFELIVDGTKIANRLEKNPYDCTFVYDICRRVDDDIEIILFIPELEESVKLVCISKDWNTDWQEAVTIFSQKYNSKIKNNTHGGKFKGEIFIKTVSNDRNFDNIYWFVMCVTKNGDVFSCLIDPTSKMILQS